MSPTVGFFGTTGTVGSALLPELVKANKDGKIKLVILHRESTDLSKLPKELETRVLDLSEAGLEKNKAALKDFDVVVSSVGAPGIDSQNYIVEALVGSANLKTFIPSDFGTNWTEKELEAPGLADIKQKLAVVSKAKSLGVPITQIRVGLFDQFFFAYKAVGVDVQGNTIQKFRNNIQAPFRITTLAYLAYAVAKFVGDESTLTKLANETVVLYDYTPTGQEIVDTLTKIHGKPTEISEYPENQYQEDLQGPYAIGAALKAQWGNNSWGATATEVEGWQTKSYEELFRQWL
ncbi:hypothetical protein IAR55_000334 [Kwoniella newhampshirensis]|uniref:NmrA-like domain-containing protein n=1 Tax=Kwoniella newhampshirensis TaxID=1651941 RepID=A0AAW0Z6C3_9TREE